MTLEEKNIFLSIVHELKKIRQLKEIQMISEAPLETGTNDNKYEVIDSDVRDLVKRYCKENRLNLKLLEIL